MIRQFASQCKGTRAWDPELGLPGTQHLSDVTHGTRVTHGRQCIWLNWAFVNFPAGAIAKHKFLYL